MPIGGDWGLRLAWKAKSVHPLLSLPSLLVLAPWRGCVFEALVWVLCGLHRHSGTSFFHPRFLIRSAFYFKCILLPSSHTLVPSTKSEQREMFSCGWFRRCERPDVSVNLSTFSLHALCLPEQLGVWSSFPPLHGGVQGCGLQKLGWEPAAPQNRGWLWQCF